MYTREFQANKAFQPDSDKISAIFDSVDSGVTMQYSADGITFTDWATPIADQNCVICNIPRGLYLKFSVGGKYTG